MNAPSDSQDAGATPSSAVAQVVADYPDNINEEVIFKGK
jgi:hypothetical protein